MGLTDFVKKSYNETKQKVMEQMEQNRQAMINYNQQTHCQLIVTAGNNHILCKGSCTMHQRPDGSVFFNSNTTRNYRLISYTWNGPLYNSITNSNTTGTEITKGKGGKIVGGAIVGSVIGPAGTLVGAAAGAGSKGKKNINSNTVSTTRNIEVATPASMKLRCIETNEVFGISFNCTSEIDTKIRLFNFDGEQTPQIEQQTPKLITDNSNTSMDSLEQLKKLKELLDMDAITQEEYDIQKKKLLNL